MKALRFPVLVATLGVVLAAAAPSGALPRGPRFLWHGVFDDEIARPPARVRVTPRPPATGREARDPGLEDRLERFRWQRMVRFLR